MFLLGESSLSELTFLVVVVPRWPRNWDPRERGLGPLCSLGT